MKRLIVIVMMAALAFTACKKSDTDVTPVPPSPEPESVLDYMPLAVGNYWIYESFSCDSGEINCVSKSIDEAVAKLLVLSIPQKVG